VNVAVNYRLKREDITYIFEYSKVDSIIVDAEFVSLLDDFRSRNPTVPFIIDTDTDSTSGSLSGPFDEAVLEGLKWDKENGRRGWGGLKAQAEDEDACIAIPFTSGTTARPKGVVYTHRGAYLAALGNVVESGLNYHTGRCGYLWTLPMFHAMGWSKLCVSFCLEGVLGVGERGEMSRSPDHENERRFLLSGFLSAIEQIRISGNS
jgi:acyl-CoA synthetase (AMP-forming)/AMP-acid ligase II